MLYGNFLPSWQRDRTRPQPSSDQPLCSAAEEFVRKVEATVIAPLGDDPTMGMVGQAKYQLQELVHEYRRTVGMPHFRGMVIGRHRCILDCYIQVFEELHAIQLRLRPPVQIIADYEILVDRPEPRPEPPEPQQVFGVGIGQLTDEMNKR